MWTGAKDRPEYLRPLSLDFAFPLGLRERGENKDHDIESINLNGE